MRLLAVALAGLLLCSAVAQGQQLPTWDCQRKGACSYYHSSPASLGCDKQPPECVPSEPGQACSARNVNIKGDVLVLDVGSLSYSGGPNHPPAVTTAAECCEACRKQAGCNAWTFCWKLDGCGSGCTPPGGKPPQQIDASKELGQFGSCAPGGKYSFRTCSLKRVDDTASPPLWDGGLDWTSGVAL